MTRLKLLEGDRSALEAEGLRLALAFDIEGLKSVVDRLTPRGRLCVVPSEPGDGAPCEPPLGPASP